ncbi:MAG: helix-hairpin-helix domain-containing protein [Bacteroidota bacterium]
MEKSFRQLVKEYFRFSKKDRNGIMVLGVIILLLISGIIVVNNINLKPENDFAEFKKALEAWENTKKSELESKSLFEFNPNAVSAEQLDSLSIPEFVKNNLLSYRSAGGKFENPTDLAKIYGMNDSIFKLIEEFIVLPENKPLAEQPKPSDTRELPKSFTGTFDPNSADSITLSEFGFNSFQASNLIRYRNSGGVFSDSEDVLKIYGVDSIFYNLIKKNIQIETVQKNDFPEEDEERPVHVIKVELNSAGKAELMQLPGVGEVFAERILKYRDLLGGFYKKEQLLEVYNFPEETFNNIAENIVADSTSIRKIRVNFAEYADLLRHPYFEIEYVEALLDYREKNGPFNSFDELFQNLPNDSVDFDAVKVYISCR